MPTEGISVVIPVLNDVRGLQELLEALASQTRPPEEVVIVDGGSTDGTKELAASWNDPHFSVRLISVVGGNIAQARNAGIETASNLWIASTDAGCRPVRGWLEAIDAARSEADFVAGVVVIESETPFEVALASTHYPQRDELDSAPLWVHASHRLFGRRYEHGRVGGGYMAFRKSVWAAVGGFPERVGASEDHGFSSAVRRQGFRIVRVPEAAVAWKPPATWIGNAAMFHRYARGDVSLALVERRLSGRVRHLVRVAAWAAGAVGAVRGGRAPRIMISLGALAYVALPVRRARRARLPLSAWWRIPLLVTLKDLAQILGAAHGVADALNQQFRRGSKRVASGTPPQGRARPAEPMATSGE